MDSQAGGVARYDDATAIAEYQNAIRDATRLNRLFAILSDPVPCSVVVDRAIIALSEMFAADVVALLERTPSGGFETIAAIGLPEGLPDLHSLGDGIGYAAATIDQRAPLLVSGARGDPGMGPQLNDLDVETAAWLPLLGSQDVLGVLFLGRCRGIPFSRPDVDLLTAMTYRIGLVLERARAEEDRARLEARLRQAEKSESLGRMAAAVAHTFNNKLTTVIGYLDLAAQELAAGRDAAAEIGESREAAIQAARIGRLMLAYVGQAQSIPDNLDLVALCRHSLPGLAAKMPAQVHLRADLPDRALTVTGSDVDLRRVLENLVANAAEAMADRTGEIVLAVRDAPASEIADLTLRASGSSSGAGPYACLEVVDSGSGMDAATIQKAFDPFFTTRFFGRGLGLAVVLGVVRAHGGAISVSSEVGRGTTFRVYLPLAAGPEGDRPGGAAQG